ncbi:Cell division control protein 48 [Durusdinium trenchii]|uniref:Cell division control protein 48 n=1 Tax=Durusdinium trenchii TaxID=1381693 RepID=A0ABP0NWA3_9DINO
MNGTSSMMSPMSPSQKKAKDNLIGAIKTKAVPLVELRSPPALGRGYGVTFVLKAVAAELGAPLLGVATALECHDKSSDGQGQAIKRLYSATVASLEKHGVAVIDDLDLACDPRSVCRSRTLVGDIKGSGDIFNWEVAPSPAMLLKALSDAASSAGGVIVFSSVEDAHLAFIKAPLTITLEESTVEDYAAVLNAMSAKQVDAEAIYALHSQLSPADLKASAARVLSKGEISTKALVSSIRDELVSVSAVAPEEVEPVDLAEFPGLENIKEELERNVLFPLENPDKAKQFGLTPKRGVLLHGQPGTGKTTVGRWLANRLKGKFFLVREMMVQADIIKVFAAAQAAAPAVVFIDDADIVIGGWRPLDGHRGSDVFRFLLGRMDGLTSRGKRQRENGDVVVILTGQNVHWMADMLLRSGRIELWLKTKLPEPRQKREILKKYIREDPGALELLGKNREVPNVQSAAQASDSFCCADLRRVVSDAKMLAAWDRSSQKTPLEGSVYLEKAAERVRSMQDEVKSTTRNLYG